MMSKPRPGLARFSVKAPTIPIPFHKLLRLVAIVFLAFQESFNRFPGFNYEVQGVFQEREEGRIKFYTYVVRQ